MAKAQQQEIPQVVAITSLGKDGGLLLNKAVREHLGVARNVVLGLDVGDEIRITRAETGEALAMDGRGKVALPGPVCEHLEAGPGGCEVALVQREGAVAVKRFVLEVTEGEWAEFSDVEIPTQLTRRAQGTSLPGTLLPRLTEDAAALALHYDVAAFLRARRNLHTWAARQRLGVFEARDESLRQELVDERLNAQGDDGAWGDRDTRVIATARALRELAELSVPGDHAAVRAAVDWLAARPESVHNPGQWFAYDDLVAEQARVVAERATAQLGTCSRFRVLNKSGQRHVMVGDELIRAPCGPRIMWPNALVLEALLRLGYEGEPRVQRALGFMVQQDWCECGYQHGTAGMTHRGAYAGERLAAVEAACVAQYRYAGLTAPDHLRERDMTHEPFRFPRVAHRSTSKGEIYALEPDLHIQGCEFITTRALAAVEDPGVRRFAEAHLWRFAGCQLRDGSFPRERHGTGFGQAGILALFARYPHHPASQVVLLRALPWIVKHQQPDGAWREAGADGDVGADAVTRSVVEALVALGDRLPDSFWAVTMSRQH